MSYYLDHREAILRRARTKITCQCGATVSYSSMGWHRRSASHQIWADGVGRIPMMLEPILSSVLDHPLQEARLVYLPLDTGIQ
jgi:hypothetical protein